MTAAKLGIIGFGIMGERLLRAALAHDAGTIAVAGVWDPAPEAQARLARELPAVTRFATAAAVIAAADCVYVASPPATHLAHARRAVAAGKALFCEKPLAVDPGEARAFVELVEAAGAPSAVNFIFASSPAVDQLRAWLAAGAVGKPERLDIEVDFAAWPRPWQMDATGWLSKRAQGGFTREVVSHFLFLSQRLLGPLDLLRSSAEFPAGEGAETAIDAELTAGGVPVKLKGRVGGTDKPDHNIWALQGPAGAIRLRDWSVAERLEAGRWQEAPDAMANEKARPLVLQRQLDKLACLTRGQPQDLATPRQALEVQEIVERILAPGRAR